MKSSMQNVQRAVRGAFQSAAVHKKCSSRQLPGGAHRSRREFPRVLTMKLIGKGWQYKVFDLGNGRVRKIELPAHYQHWLILYQWLRRANSASFIEVYDNMKRFRTMCPESVSYIKSIYHLLDKQLLGNPVFLDKNNYEQDKVRTIEDCFRDFSLDECKKTIDAYIKLLLDTWTYGFSDAVFNFMENNGFNKKRELVQVDFGEIVFSKEIIKSHIINQTWLQSWSYARLQNRALKEYFRRAMTDDVNISNLHRLWGAKVMTGLSSLSTENPLAGPVGKDRSLSFGKKLPWESSSRRT